MKHAILSVSGGLDSSTLLLRCLKDGYQCHIVNFNYGSKQNDVEKSYLLKNLQYLKEKGYEVEYKEYDLSGVMGNFNSSLTRSNIDTPEGEYSKENQPIIFVPNRNMIMFSLIAGIAESLYEDTKEEIIIGMGVHKSENPDAATYPDCTPEFFKKVFAAFKQGNYENKIGLFIPYANKFKLNVLKDGIKCCKALKLKWDRFYENTFSCYSPKDGKACGKCPTCIERHMNFVDLGLDDVTTYIDR